jgi:opacity protein-like surface antigen
LPFSISFIANIARKRTELNRDKSILNTDGLDTGNSFLLQGNFDTSGALRLAVGSTFGSSFRGEVELSCRDMQFADELLLINDSETADSKGDAAITAFMVNGLYSMPIGSSGYVGYFGGGLGVAQVHIDLQRGPISPDFVMIQGDYTSLAAQLRVGAERQLNNKMTLFTDYTYFHMPDKDFSGFNIFFGVGAPQSFGPINSHEIAVGLRISF